MNKTLHTLLLAGALLASGAAVFTSPAKQAPEKPRFVLLFHESTQGFAQRTGPKSEAYWTKWRSYIQSLQQSGMMTEGAGFQVPATGKRLGKADTSGLRPSGYVIVQAPTLAVASDLAQACPAIRDGGAVEVRPLLPMSEQEGRN